jgi:hypothetical protein
MGHLDLVTWLEWEVHPLLGDELICLLDVSLALTFCHWCRISSWQLPLYGVLAESLSLLFNSFVGPFPQNEFGVKVDNYALVRSASYQLRMEGVPRNVMFFLNINLWRFWLVNRFSEWYSDKGTVYGGWSADICSITEAFAWQTQSKTRHW